MNQKKQRFFNLTALEWLAVTAAACILHGVMQGIHDNYGIMMSGLLGVTGIDYAAISFCIGTGALVYGFSQPFLGMIALKKSNAFVILMGILFTVIGLIATPLCRSFWSLFLFFGLVLPFGTTGLCFGIIMGAITPLLGEKRAALVSGFVQASAGVGDALMSPILEKLISALGIRSAMDILAVPFITVIPIALWIGFLNRKRAKTQPETSGQTSSLFSMIGEALHDRDYRLILLGFGTCGFNMSIIESHLFSQFRSWGIPGSLSSLTLTVYGIATMIGAAAVGILSVKFRTKNVLACVYACRVLISAGFLFLPKSIPLAFLATALLGLSGDSTVPPTSGIISQKFGSGKMAILYGFALIGHQIGAFVSSYLGGVLVKAGLGYSPLWAVNLCLAAFAAACSFSIRHE